MMRKHGGYVPDASDESSGVAPTSVTALTPIECASCKLLRQRIEELEAELESWGSNYTRETAAEKGAG